MKARYLSARLRRPFDYDLELYHHPLASFCWKVLIALYEAGTPFRGQIVDLRDEAARRELEQLWPVGKFPVLRDLARDQTLPESSIIIEYLDRHYPGAVTLIPADPAPALEARLWDRFFDLYLQAPMQKLVGDKLRPEGDRDSYGVNEAKTTIETAYAMLERRMNAKTWVVDDRFSLADCAAMPALYYANRIVRLALSGPMRTRTSAACSRAHRWCACWKKPSRTSRCFLDDAQAQLGAWICGRSPSAVCSSRSS